MTDCIEWKKYPDPTGYGRICVKGKVYKAHRYFYEQKYGKIPEGMVIDHLCRNVSCVNTDHLEVVTVKENTRRGLSAKIKYSDVLKIKYLYKARMLTQVKLAKLFGLTQSSISLIVNNRRWLP